MNISSKVLLSQADSQLHYLLSTVLDILIHKKRMRLY